VLTVSTMPDMLAAVARLYAHLDWADRRALETLRATPDPDATRLLAHVLAAEHVWLARLRGEPPSVPVWPELALDRCEALAEANRRGYADYLAALAPDDLAREVAYANSAGEAFRSRVDDVLLHVALHGQYHRGQVALLARFGGGAPLPTDYIAFVRGAPAAVTPVTLGPR
jgi:uncharacterized damage-inducible protein DinB